MGIKKSLVKLCVNRSVDDSSQMFIWLEWFETTKSVEALCVYHRYILEPTWIDQKGWTDPADHKFQLGRSLSSFQLVTVE